MLSFNLKFDCCNFRNNYAIIIVVVQHKKMSLGACCFNVDCEMIAKSL